MINDDDQIGGRYLIYLISRGISLDPWEADRGQFWAVQKQGYMGWRVCTDATRRRTAAGDFRAHSAECAPVERCREPGNILPAPY